MSHHKVIADQIYFAYPDGNVALEDISFTIHHGESVAITGDNGAGKSTLLRLLMGLNTPQKGTIQIGEIPMTKETLPYIRQNIGYTFQNPDHQLFMGNVYEDIAFGPRNIGLAEPQVRLRVEAALKDVGALHLIDRSTYKLSGGEKRSVAIATVLSMDPSILIFDEPTTGLDGISQQRLISLLQSFHHTRLIATHDLSFIEQVCTRIIRLEKGKIISDTLI